MPTYCLVPGCRPSSRRVSYHSLPRNQELARHWLELCGRQDLIDSKRAKHSKVCSAHFRKSDFKSYHQYTLMTMGSSAARPRLNDDAVPTFVSLGWKKIRTGFRKIRPLPSESSEGHELRQQYVSDALRDYESSQLVGGAGGGVQEIRHRLKMRRRAAQRQVQLVQVDRRGDQVLVGGTFSQLAAGRQEAGRAAAAPRQDAPVRVFASRGIAEQLAAETGADGDQLDVQAARMLEEGVAWGREEAAPGRDGRVVWSAGGESPPGLGTPPEAAAGPPLGWPGAAGSQSLPPDMPDRLQEILGRQRRVRSLQLTVRRQTEQLHELQARHEVDLEEQGLDAEAAALFPPVGADLAEEEAVGGDMLLSPATLDEAHGRLHRLRAEVLELRARLLEGAVAANERALAANRQRAELLRVFTPRQTETLLGGRPAADVWDAEDLRRALALRRVLSRRQYEYVRDVVGVPLPALRPTAAAAQREPEVAQLYRQLLEQRRPSAAAEEQPAGRRRAAAARHRPSELLILRAEPAAAADQPESALTAAVGRLEQEEEADRLPLELPVIDEVEVGGSGEDDPPPPPPPPARSRPLKVAVTPGQPLQPDLETHAALWDDHFM